MSRVPDAATSSNVFVKSEPIDIDADAPPSAPSSSGGMHHRIDEDENDPIVRTIDVFISPQLSNTLHLLQFPIQPAAASTKQHHSGRQRYSHNSTTPAEARFRPMHNMLELEYPIPSSAQAGRRQLPDKMCLSQRVYASNSVAPVTHMALAKLNREGTRLNVVPLQKHVLQMRPSFRHLHDEEDEDPNNANASAAAADDSNESSGRPRRQRPIMYQKKESERAERIKRNSYAYKRASEESEEWIDLGVHGSHGKWSSLRKDAMLNIKCQDRDNVLTLARDPKRAAEEDGGYVKSLNYLDSIALVGRGSGKGGGGGEGFVENLSDWAPSATTPAMQETTTADDDDDDMLAMDDAASAAPEIGATEQATAELASKLVILLQNGNGTMIPYRILRSRFHPSKVSDEILTVALSSCAVLVRGNFALQSHLAKFLTSLAIGGGEERKRLLRDLRDLILLLLNMHGMVQRERLVRAYAAKAERGGGRGYEGITADIITFVLTTVARKDQDRWVAKVEDDEEFAGVFSEVAACHGVYWMKKKEMLMPLVELYEGVEVDPVDDDVSV
mmetsp:Transcript_27027/g.46101  ORF Transcript_27027/g.46101 Transcript_27027/m.46101 type:complete len:559 (+) Transcript_27027:57-1733(+)